MTEASAFEQLGRLYVALRLEQMQHRRTIDVLRQIKSGELDLDRLNVDGDGWRVLPTDVVGSMSTTELRAVASGAKDEED